MFVVRNLELCCLIMSLSEALLKKEGKDEVIVLTLDCQAKFNSTLANIIDLKSDFGMLEPKLSISRSVNSKLYDKVASRER